MTILVGISRTRGRPFPYPSLSWRGELPDRNISGPSLNTPAKFPRQTQLTTPAPSPSRPSPGLRQGHHQRLPVPPAPQAGRLRRLRELHFAQGPGADLRPVAGRLPGGGGGDGAGAGRDQERLHGRQAAAGAARFCTLWPVASREELTPVVLPWMHTLLGHDSAHVCAHSAHDEYPSPMPPDTCPPGPHSASTPSSRPSPPPAPRPAACWCC